MLDVVLLLEVLGETGGLDLGLHAVHRGKMSDEGDELLPSLRIRSELVRARLV